MPVVRRSEDFDVFYRSEYRQVLGLAIVLSGNRSAAEELTQDAFLAAYKSWDHVGPMDNPGAWVRRLVANRSVSRTSAAATEAAIDIWHEVRALPKRQAQVIALTYLEDLSRRDIASILEISAETVKTHLDRARTTLATKLTAHRMASHGH
jgi:RNA polymerase sigma-70 factor (ECF subfamily)